LAPIARERLDLTTGRRRRLAQSCPRLAGWAERANLIEELLGDQVKGLHALLCARQDDGSFARGNEHSCEPLRIPGLQSALFEKLGESSSPRSFAALLR
jgi:hypothetical protein